MWAARSTYTLLIHLQWTSLEFLKKKKKRNPEEKNVQKKSEGDKREAEGEKRGEKQVSLGGGGPVFMMDRSRE